MNKQKYQFYSEQLRCILPSAFTANSARYADTDSGPLKQNYLKFREAACVRFWLYLDLSFEPSKALRWIEVFCQQDQYDAESMFGELYEFFRRENLLSYSVSQFKAAFGHHNAINVRWWLGPLWCRVEELLLKDSAKVSETEYIDLIRDVVQWTRLSSKLKLENPLLDEEAFKKFEANELRLRDLWSKPDEVRDQYLKGMASIVDKMIDQRNFKPLMGHHGSGAVFEKEAGRYSWKKHKFLNQTDSRLKFFDKRFDFAINPMGYESFIPDGECLVSQASRPSTVPKNLKVKRFIAMQPVARMYREQGTLGGYYAQWASNPYLRRHFPIFDRTCNQDLARKGSLRDSHGWCTIDLQSASDSVSVQLVKACTKGNLRYALLLTRAKALGDLQLEATYATMGDATVFPTETLLIGAAVQLALDQSRKIWPKIPNHYLVFGDDIICPNNEILLSRIHDIFSRIGFLINDDKSFYHGPYRESCGVEAYLGWDIQPWYLRVPSTGVERLQSLIGAANSCLEKGLRNTRRYFIYEYAKACHCSVKLLPFTENLEDSSRFHTDSLCYGYLRTVKTPKGEYSFGQYERKELRPVGRVVSTPNEEELAAEEAYKLTQWHYRQTLHTSNEMTLLHMLDSGVRFHRSGQHDLKLKKCWTSVEDLLR